MNPEIFGIPAMVLVFLSYLFTNQVKLRIINIVGCVVFIAYGLAIAATTQWQTGWSTVVLNTASFIVHLVWLIRYKINKKNTPKLLQDTKDIIDESK